MKIKGLFLAALLFLTACGAASPSSAVPTVVLGGTPAPGATPTVQSTGAGGVTASGNLVSGQEAHMALTIPGTVKAVDVTVGMTVQAGQTLVELDDTAQQIAFNQAQQQLLDLTSPAAIAIAQKTLAQDQQNLTNAQASLNNLLYRENNTDAIQNSQADLVLAQDALSKAQEAYNQVAGNPDRDANKAYAYQQLYAAQLAYNQAAATYNLWTGKSNQAQIDLKTADLALAKATLAEDQALLTALTGGTLPANATGSGITQLQQARLGVQAAQHNLDATRLTAPFAGVVGAVNAAPGDYLAPGQMVLVLTDLSRLHVETTDLSERDIHQVAVGQTATVTIQALNQNVTGKVTAISPTANTLGGDVVYTVVIDMDTLPQGAYSGMSVTVSIDTSK